MTNMWILLWLFLTVPAFADTTLPLDKPVDAGGLTDELKAAVPSLEGVAVEGDRLFLRKLEGEFTKAEKTRLAEILSAHDATKRDQAEQQRVTDRQEGLNALKSLGLTDAQLKALFP